MELFAKLVYLILCTGFVVLHYTYFGLNITSVLLVALLIYLSPNLFQADQKPQSCDLLICGYGCAGAVAALHAAQISSKNKGILGDGFKNEDEPYKIIIVEKYDGGGSTCRSGGVVYSGGGTLFQKSFGINDEKEEMYKYLKAELEESISDSVLRKFVNESADDIKWLGDLGVKINDPKSDSKPFLKKCQQPPVGHTLYHSGSELAHPYNTIARSAPRGHLPEGPRSMVGAGHMLWQGLDAAVKRLPHSIVVYPCTSATELIRSADGSEVKGIKAKSLRNASVFVRMVYIGLYSFASMVNPYQQLTPIIKFLLNVLVTLYSENINFEAKDGTILATGGFCRNECLIKEFMPEYSDLFPLGALGDDGSGIELARKLGADLSLMRSGASWKFLYAPLSFLKAVFVNKAGKRLLNEDVYGAKLGKISVEEEDGRTWFVFDRKIWEEAYNEIRSGKVQALAERLQGYLNLFINCEKANTITSLALKCGIEQQELRKTIDMYNDMCRAGCDETFGKHVSFLQEIASPPFYAINYSSRGTWWFTPWLTMGGLKVEENSGRVLTADTKKMIPRLYAAGRCAAGLPFKSYVSGLSLADCIFSGKRAARDALERAKVHKL